MSFIEQYRPDLGFGGTSFGYDVIKTVGGETFSCFGNGVVDQVFLPQKTKEIIAVRVGYDHEIMSARYTYSGDLIEVNVFLKEFYDHITLKDLPIDTDVKKDLNSITNNGVDPVAVYVDLSARVIGFVSGDDLESDISFTSENHFETENEDGGWVIPVYDEDDDLDIDLDQEDLNVPSEEKVVQFSIDGDYVRAHFKLNSDDTFVQSFARKIDTFVFGGTPSPKAIRDLLKTAFPEGV